jgi:hypothetical protein
MESLYNHLNELFRNYNSENVMIFINEIRGSLLVLFRFVINYIYA